MSRFPLPPPSSPDPLWWLLLLLLDPAAAAAALDEEDDDEDACGWSDGDSANEDTACVTRGSSDSLNQTGGVVG